MDRVNRELRRVQAHKAARRYSSRGHRFPFSVYPSTKTAFWPGCSLSGARPALARQAADRLGRTLGCDVGIVLDCCFDPLLQLGDTDSVGAAATRIRQRLKKHGIERLIVGCVNCAKVFRQHLPDIASDTVIGLLSSAVFSMRGLESSAQGVYLHHPCPSSRIDGLQDRIRDLLREMNVGFREAGSAQCCGLGGGLNVIAPDRARSFVERTRAAAAGRPVVTYCMGCKDRFLQHGLPAVHVLEFLKGAEPSYKRVGPVRYWSNRLALSFRESLAMTETEISSL